MNILPITTTRPACYGIGCPRHGECTRYAAVELTTWEQTIGTCYDGAGGRPLFVPVAAQTSTLAVEVHAC